MGNIEIQCTGCERIVEYDEDDFSYGVTCESCANDFEEVCSDDDNDIEDIDGESYEDYKEQHKKDTVEPSIVIDNSVRGNRTVNKFDPEAKSRFD